MERLSIETDACDRFAPRGRSGMRVIEDEVSPACKLEFSKNSGIHCQDDERH